MKLTTPPFGSEYNKLAKSSSAAAAEWLDTSLEIEREREREREREYLNMVAIVCCCIYPYYTSNRTKRDLNNMIVGHITAGVYLVFEAGVLI